MQPGVYSAMPGPDCSGGRIESQDSALHRRRVFCQKAESSWQNINISSDNIGYIVSTYYDNAALAFGRREFTTAEFARRLGTPRAAKVLNEMKTRGLIERTGRGRYRLLGPEERPDLRHEEARRTRSAIREAPFKKAWTGPTAVGLWTRGRYKVAPSVFTPELHVSIHPEDKDGWNAYLRKRKVPIGRKHIGPRVIMHADLPEIRVEKLDGEPVLSREDTLRLVRANPSVYGSAEDLFD